jgi:hypothetical protein
MHVAYPAGNLMIFLALSQCPISPVFLSHLSYLSLLSALFPSFHPVLCEKSIYINIIRFEVLTAVTMKNVVFWDIKTQFVLHRRHITSPLQSSAT